MKRILFILFLCCIGSGLAACQDEDHTVPTLPSGNDPEINDPVVEFYDWEKNRTELLTSTDMVLLYGGGHHRTPYTWDKERVSSYIRYVDTDNQSHWLFDSFLFLEIMDTGTGGANKMFAKGYNLPFWEPHGRNVRLRSVYQSPLSTNTRNKHPHQPSIGGKLITRRLTFPTLPTELKPANGISIRYVPSSMKRTINM